EMARVSSRQRLVCLFGEPVGPGGYGVEVRPWSWAFASMSVAVSPRDHRSESLVVTFARDARPLVESVDRALGPSREALRHFEAPRSRWLDQPAPEGVHVRVSFDLADDDPKRVAQMSLSMDDLRGWTPPPMLGCQDAVDLLVHIPSVHRFPPGKY